MDALEILKDDHEQVRYLVNELARTTESQEAEAAKLLAELSNALSLHTRIEEEVLYPALEPFDETTDLVKEGRNIHQEVGELIKQISFVSPGKEQFQDRVAELRDKFEQHIDENESRIFPEAEEIFSNNRLRQLGKRMEEIRNVSVAAAGSQS
jgi:hemerythrin-like domain-containing protein